MQIGALGNVSFYASDKAVQTIKEIEWSASASYSTHKLHLKVGKQELTGRNPDQISFTVELSRYLGVNPWTAMNELQKMLRNGKVVTLVLGKKVYGSKWVLTDLKRTLKRFHKDGTLISADVSITIKEYS